MIIADINYQMDIAYSDTGDYPNGEKYIEEAIKFNDEVYDYFYFKAYVYQNMNEFDKALKIYDDMALIDEDPMFCLRCKGKLLATSCKGRKTLRRKSWRYKKGN